MIYYKSLVLLLYFKVIKEFTFLIYLSMSIDNVIIGRQEWVYSFVQNYCSKQKQKTEVCYTFYSIIMYTLYLYSWKNEILIMQLNNLYHDFSRTIKNIPASFRLSFLKIADLTVFLLFSIWKLLSHRGDIEENPGHKYSLLTFCHWNLNGLTAHDSTEISLLQAYISNTTMTLYA